MSKNTILVHTQLEENYGFHEGTQYWKKKGGHTFQIEMDADLLMYSDTAAIFGKMVESQSNDLERFTFLEYEVQWQTPSVLGTQSDYIKVNESLELEGNDADGKSIELDENADNVIAGVDFSDSIKQLNNLTSNFRK